MGNTRWYKQVLKLTETSRARIPTIYDLDIDPGSDAEKGDEAKERATPVSCSDDVDEKCDPVEPEGRIIRFEDGDPENPNNWGMVQKPP